MKLPRSSRWLQVATRAAEFRTLLNSGELIAATHLSGTADESLRESRASNERLRGAWRQSLAGQTFHSTDDLRFRQYHAVLSGVESDRSQAAELARAALTDVQSSLQEVLAEKNSLRSAVDRLLQRQLERQAQQDHRDADELWLLGCAGVGIARDDGGTP
jgi:hypothetical protein